MTPKGDQMTPEDDHYGMIRLTPLSPVRYTKYYVHIG